jgi:hypothetical protein
MWRGDVMRIPVIRGVIDRRILVNYRVDAEVLASVLPAPFRPKVVRGVGMVGICLIRLKGVGPRFFPVGLGVSSENAAHRAAVEWDDEGAVREGFLFADEIPTRGLILGRAAVSGHSSTRPIRGG